MAALRCCATTRIDPLEPNDSIAEIDPLRARVKRQLDDVTIFAVTAAPDQTRAAQQLPRLSAWA